jgi:hypothetical protein
LSTKAANWLVIAIFTLLVVLVGAVHGPGIFPQVVSCVPQHEPERHTGPNWQPTLIVAVEPGRDPGRVREYRVLGCTFYYYHRNF